MAIDHNKYLRKQHVALSTFSNSYMSNSKWLKLFKTLSVNLDVTERCKIITIYNSDIPNEFELPPLEEFQDTYHEKGIKDVLTGGPVLFKEIRLIELHLKDSDSFEKTIQQLGHFFIERDNNILKVYGYK